MPVTSLISHNTKNDVLPLILINHFPTTIGVITPFKFIKKDKYKNFNSNFIVNKSIEYRAKEIQVPIKEVCVLENNSDSTLSVDCIGVIEENDNIIEYEMDKGVVHYTYFKKDNTIDIEPRYLFNCENKTIIENDIEIEDEYNNFTTDKIKIFSNIFLRGFLCSINHNNGKSELYFTIKNPDKNIVGDALKNNDLKMINFTNLIWPFFKIENNKDKNVVVIRLEDDIKTLFSEYTKPIIVKLERILPERKFNVEIVGHGLLIKE